MLELGRAVGETFQPGAGRYGGGVAGLGLGALVGHLMAPGIGGYAGGAIGSMVGHVALDRLAKLRVAGTNAMNTLRGPRPPSNALNMGQLAAPAAAGAVPMMAPNQ